MTEHPSGKPEAAAETEAASASAPAPSEPAPRPPTLLQVMGSVFSAVLGVQKQQRREYDFAHGKPLHYIIAGVLFAASLVMLVAGTAWLVLRLTVGG